MNKYKSLLKKHKRNSKEMGKKSNFWVNEHFGGGKFWLCSSIGLKVAMRASLALNLYFASWLSLLDAGIGGGHHAK